METKGDRVSLNETGGFVTAKLSAGEDRRPAGLFGFAPFISPGETKRFAWHAVSRWNPYERRISNFAELFVFNSLTPFSFRRFHAVFVVNDLAPFFVSPRNSQALPPDLAPQGAPEARLEALP